MQLVTLVSATTKPFVLLLMAQVCQYHLLYYDRFSSHVSFHVIQYFYLKCIYICNYSSLIFSNPCKPFSLHFAPCILICLKIPVIFRHICKIAKSDYDLRHVCPSGWNNSAPDIQIFMNFDTSVLLLIFFKSDEKIQVLLESDKNRGYFA